MFSLLLFWYFEITQTQKKQYTEILIAFWALEADEPDEYFKWIKFTEVWVKQPLNRGDH